jgi:signal transduction histidine kinase
MSNDATAAPTTTPAPDDAWQHERFAARAMALFYARLGFLTLGLGVLAFPRWQQLVGASYPSVFITYFTIIAYAVVNFLVRTRGRLGRAVTFVTLNVDLVILIYIVTWSGGLRSPVIAAQLVFTMLFAVLFPRPLAILPPLLALPVVAKIDQILGRVFTLEELFLLAWHFAINFIAVYVIVYLNNQEENQHREILRLQDEIRDLAVADERSRLARDIHDGLGASLSGLLIQAEYLNTLTDDAALHGEIEELRTAAAEGMAELRRSISMMRDDFDLVQSMEETVAGFEQRARIETRLDVRGHPARLPSDVQLAIFRVLQESLTNVIKHAEAAHVGVELSFPGAGVALTVRDDGRGFAMKDGLRGHYGLAGMRERARKVGATVDIESSPGSGTVVRFQYAT